MKKTYINPEMLVVKVQTQQMLASSPGPVPYGGSTEQNLSPSFYFEE